MKTNLFIWWLLLVCSVSAVRSQVLVGDPQFSVLHLVGWGMSIGEIRSVYEKIQKPMGVTDSSLTLNTEFFGVPAFTEIRFQQTRRGPAFIRIKFSEPSKALVDTISKHFTQFARRAPVITATEKKLFTISLRMEIAKWKTDKESIALTMALQDGIVGEVGLIILVATDREHETF
jgi:hypothetical protein